MTTRYEKDHEYDQRCVCGVMRTAIHGKCRWCGSTVLQADNLRGLPTDELRAALAEKDRWGNPVADRVRFGGVLYWLRPSVIIYELLDRLDKETARETDREDSKSEHCA